MSKPNVQLSSGRLRKKVAHWPGLQAPTDLHGCGRRARWFANGSVTERPWRPLQTGDWAHGCQNMPWQQGQRGRPYYLRAVHRDSRRVWQYLGQGPAAMAAAAADAE